MSLLCQEGEQVPHDAYNLAGELGHALLDGLDSGLGLDDAAAAEEVVVIIVREQGLLQVPQIALEHSGYRVQVQILRGPNQPKRVKPGLHSV